MLTSKFDIVQKSYATKTEEKTNRVVLKRVINQPSEK